MYQHGLIAPVVALVLWSLVVCIWLYVTRIPAMQAARIDPNAPGAREKIEALPARVRQVADNYNHLMEQPTIFYATCFALQWLNQDQPINIGLAWTYVALRIAHSLIQNTVNIITLRFTIFMISSVVLGAMAVHAALAMLRA